MWPLVVVLLFSAVACETSGGKTSSDGPPETEAPLFRRGTPGWLGGDAAFSVALGDERILWLFGDSFVSAEPPYEREASTMVHNSVAIQHGNEPSDAEIDFYWSGGKTPGAYFATGGDRWLWPGGGIVVEGALTLFMWEMVQTSEGMFGFDAVGWRALRVDHPVRPADEWRPRRLGRNDLVHDILPGSFGLEVRGDHVYAFGASDAKPHPVYAARWTRSAFRRGRVDEVDWWYGEDRGWRKLDADEAPVALFDDAQTEGSIHYSGGHDAWIAVHSVGFGSTDIGLRTAPSPIGPWTDADRAFRPPESDRDLLVYAAKAHPWAPGDGLLTTYATNHSDFERLVADDSLYYPQFARLHIE